MYHYGTLHPFTACFVAAAQVCLWAPKGEGGGPENKASDASIYHSDPQHLWNRVHAALFVRVGPDGHTYGHDRLEPLLWLDSNHLLEERSRTAAMTVLQEFVTNHGEELIDDPLKRALLQRDLWLVFNSVERQKSSGKRPRFGAQAGLVPRSGLSRALTEVLKRLALSSDEIRNLPDNYAAAVVSGEFAASYNSEHADESYLPPDLFGADGPWVLLGRPDGPVAREHVHEDFGNAFTNSVFLVFLRLPEGRAATSEFLKRLRAFVANEGKRPEFPLGTETALVRRAFLIDSSDALVASPLTESIQVRSLRIRSDFYEFRLSRHRLFAGKGGGLKAVGPDERDFKTGFRAHAYDVFDRDSSAQLFGGRQLSVRKGCITCHGLPGVTSFNSFFNYRGVQGRDILDGSIPPPNAAILTEASLTEALAAGVKWKQSRPDWTALRTLLTD